ncbi:MULTISPECIES: thioesterase family protein [unclassified Streptomyces]|uniref:thioesterase family protein n=1 Tax=unclassified Streptomyces TaxID=2593676 RepID=UPI000371B877|nr:MULTISPECIES: thioesterase family protein [unclassified Streptomyces]MYX34201.1 thioesterase family protein [Streptomyces sp. SID8377]
MHEKYGFDRETAVTARPGEPSVYDAELHEGWRIGMGVNGGLLLALAGRALAGELGGGGQGHRDPFSISAYYLSTSLPGPVTARTETLRRGRTVSTGMVSLVQDGEERLRAIATYGDLDGHDHAGDVRTSATPPQMPPPQDCVGTEAAPPEFLKNSPMLERIELRLDPDTVGWAVGAPSGRGIVQGWLRMPDGREPDPLMLLLAVDSLPPVSFDLGIPGWAPTLELTAHVRARPEPGWLRLKHSTRNFADGYMEEDAEVWDSAGRLVAQSRQLARVRMPEGTA